MPEISSRDFGRLEADVKNLTELARGIDNKMNGVMTRTEFNDVIRPIVATQKIHEERLDAHDKINNLRAASIWSRIGVAADNTFVSVIGKVIFLVFGALIASYFLTNYNFEIKSAPEHNNVRGE